MQWNASFVLFESEENYYGSTFSGKKIVNAGIFDEEREMCFPITSNSCHNGPY